MTVANGSMFAPLKPPNWLFSCCTLSLLRSRGPQGTGSNYAAGVVCMEASRWASFSHPLFLSPRSGWFAPWKLVSCYIIKHHRDKPPTPNDMKQNQAMEGVSWCKLWGCGDF